MDDLNNSLRKYRNISLPKYVNEVLPKYEDSIIQMERDKIYKTKSLIEDVLFKIFIQNSDNLLGILSTYEEVYKSLNDLKDVSLSLKRLNMGVDYMPETKYVNEKKLKEFQSLIKKFTTDLSSFDTGKRILKKFEILVNDKKEKFIFLMTNDILIIGKILEGNKYHLVNAFNYNVIKMIVQDNTLELENIKTKFHGETEKIHEIYKIYKELSYSFEDEIIEDDRVEDKDSKEIINYIIKTERYELLEDIETKELSDYLRKNKTSEIYFCEKTVFMQYLKILYKKNLIGEYNSIIIKFLKNEFIKGLNDINKIKTLIILIDEVFEYFYKFYNEQSLLLQEIKEINHIKVLLLIEEELIECFKYFEKRIFNKRFHSKSLGEILNYIEKKLKFEKQDYSYLIDLFKEKISEQNNYYLNIAKREIDKLVEEYINTK